MKMSAFQFLKPVTVTQKTMANIRSRRALYWEKTGDRAVLKFFAFVKKKVSGYRDFLAQNGAAGARARTIADFKKLPIPDKKTYIKTHAMEDLLPRGDMGRLTTISCTSGSTGEPSYFPRGEEQDWQYEHIAELFLRNQFDIEQKKTLGIIGFGLGIWIGGIFTYKNLNSIAQKGYALTLAPVGTNKNIFLKTFKDLAHHFDQVLLMGYPPFIKDVLDEGRDRGIAWGSHRIKILTATEGFSERFRLYLAKKAGIQNPLRDIINVYGTVELGTMAHETPVANLIRRLAVRHKGVYRSIFPDATLLPTLAQYYPHLTYFEEVGGELVATGFGSSYPLVRYRLHDRGGVIGFDEMIEKFKELNIDILAQAMRAGIGETIMRLPFVYVYERSDFVVVLRGANIYPEHIRAALQLRELEADVTGKCAIAKKEDKKLSERLEVHVELRKGVPQIAARIRRVSKAILAELCARNSEFAYLYTTEGTSIAPRILLHSYEDPVYFPPGIKQKWVIR